MTINSSPRDNLRPGLVLIRTDQADMDTMYRCISKN